MNKVKIEMNNNFRSYRKELENVMSILKDNNIKTKGGLTAVKPIHNIGDWAYVPYLPLKTAKLMIKLLPKGYKIIKLFTK